MLKDFAGRPMLVLLVVSTGFALCALPPNSLAATMQTTMQGQGTSPGGLTFKTPLGWEGERPSSSVRVAQFKLPNPDAGEGGEAALLVLYYFGAGQGGSVDANVDRWISQLKQADDSDSKGKARTEEITVNGLKVTLVDVSGTYIAEIAPGSAIRNNKPNYRLVGAIVETPKGPYFAKLVGPEKTVRSWRQSFLDFVNSFEFK